jgi:CheY-like chemotaxis protein
MTQSPSVPIRVLVVDDDEGVKALMSELLRREELSVDCATDGEMALERIRRNRYDAIVLDLMLPKTSGFEVLRFIKNEHPLMLPRTVVVTAASNMTLRDFDDGQKVQRVLRKPFDISEFVQTVLACSRAGSTQVRSEA